MHIHLVVICICNSETCGHSNIQSHLKPISRSACACKLVQLGSNSVNKSINVCKLLQFLVWFCDILEVT